MSRVAVRWKRFVRHRERLVRGLLFAGLFIGAFFLIVFWVNSLMRPIVSQLAQVRVNYLASKAINEAVTKRIDEGDIQYSRLVYFEKDIYGQITALRTDMIQVNRLKSNIITDVIEAVESIGTSDLGIPIGNIINGNLFSGRGPSIPVRIMPLGSAGAQFRNVFSSAGINQTRHQIMLEISADISVLLPGYSASTNVTVEVNVAETIIVGAVPDSYMNFAGGFSDIVSEGD